MNDTPIDIIVDFLVECSEEWNKSKGCFFFF